MDYKDLRDLARIAVSADPKAPVAYSFGEENFTLDQVNAALATEFRALAPDYRSYKENQNTIFRLIEETINEVLPAKVEQQYMQFAEVQRIAQGDKAIFRQRITEAAKTRAKKKISEGSEEILDSIRKGYVTYVINTSTEGVNQNIDGKLIRRAAIDNNVTVFTCLDTVKVLLDVLEEVTMGISVIDKE